MKQCDVLVIGGGPAGSTVSALLAEKGWAVTQLEKNSHPKFHIGESLLPMNLPILKRLGVLEQIHEIGIQKNGVEFNCPTREKPKTYHFKNALNRDHTFSYEVQRDKFDKILFDNARQKGVDNIENIQVTNIDFNKDGSSIVHAEDKNNETHSWNAKYLIDASGRSTFLGNKFKTKQRSKEHSSAAIFGHFENVERREGINEGNISIYWFEHGWFWFIPFKDGTMSVGAVCWPYYLSSRKVDVEQFLMETIKLSDGATERMKNAKLISPVTATGNFSYKLNKMYGKGHLIIGDAYAFIDPVFSSGVLFSMNSAEQAASVVDKILHDPACAPKQLKKFERMILGGLKTFSWFIYRVTQPSMRNLFMGPPSGERKKFFQIENAVMSLLAGDIFHKTKIKRRLFVFKLFYYVNYLLDWRANREAYLRRHRGIREQ